MRINFVTPCSRPQNLKLIENSIFETNLRSGLDVRWYIVFDEFSANMNDAEQKFQTSDTNRYIYSVPKAGIGGNAARNLAVSKIDDGYIHMVDDDNILHPHFYTLMKTLQSFNEHVFVGHQVFKTGKIRLVGIPENMKKCKVDSASIVWHRNLSVDIPFEVGNYEADGIFTEQLKCKYDDRFVYTNAVISYYNALV